MSKHDEFPAEMVERVARAMAAGAGHGNPTFVAPAYRASARAALRALRDAGALVGPDQVAVPREEVERVAEWFHDYAEGHSAQGKHDKAERNVERRDFVRHWLAAAPSSSDPRP